MTTPCQVASDTREPEPRSFLPSASPFVARKARSERPLPSVAATKTTPPHATGSGTRGPGGAAFHASTGSPASGAQADHDERVEFPRAWLHSRAAGSTPSSFAAAEGVSR